MFFVITLKIGLGFSEDYIVYNKGYKTREEAENAGKKALEDYNNDPEITEWCFGYSIHAIFMEQ